MSRYQAEAGVGYAGSNAMPEITDAYAHCGMRKYKPLAELTRVADRYGVARTVLVEHMGEFDNSYIGATVHEQPDRFSGVFLVEMDEPDANRTIANWASTGNFRGIRMLAPSILSHLALWEYAAELGLHFVVSGPFPAEQTVAIGRFAEAHPKNMLQLTHLGSPDAADSPGFVSLDPLLSLSSANNVHVQVSGMHQLSKAPYTDLIPAISRVYEAFGSERVLYGSNFPVMVEDSVYGLEIALLQAGKLGIPTEAIPAVMDGNARRLWFSRKSLRAGCLVWRCAFG